MHKEQISKVLQQFEDHEKLEVLVNRERFEMETGLPFFGHKEERNAIFKEVFKRIEISAAWSSNLTR